MEAVFALADRVTVLIGGRVLASGSPETIRRITKCGAPWAMTHNSYLPQ